MGERLVVVIPAFNEQKTIPTAVTAIAEHQRQKPDALIVVDNNSDDRTPDILKDLQGVYGEDFLHVLNEGKKGTGAACKTGFEYALQMDASVIARTDADTVPYPGWCRAIGRYFLSRPNVVSCAGITTTTEDEFYEPKDKIRVPVGMLAFRALNSVRRRSLMPAFATHGHNMALRADAYKKVGGFEPTAIEACDEDLVLFEKIYAEYGPWRTGFNPLMVVGSSARRSRTIGAKGSASYYDNLDPNLTPEERAERRIQISGGNVDIR